MEIPLNLRALIEKNNRVILPGIGAFYKKRTEGFFDENRNSFYPPKEDISFSYNLIERADQSSYSEAEVNFITSLTDKAKESISKSGEFYLKDLGNLKRKGDVIVFEKTLDQHNFNSSFFGLPVLDLPKEEPKPVLIPESVSVIATTPYVNTNQGFSLAEQALSVSMESESEPVVSESKSKIWLFSFLILIILGLGGFAFYQFNPQIVDNVWKQLNPDQKINTAPPTVVKIDSDSLDKQIADSIYNQNIETELANQGFEAEKLKDSADISIQKRTVPNPNGIRYEIIISAWRTEAKALSELKKLRANGIDAHIVDDAGGLMIKISAATLYSKEDAEKELRRIREELNPEAFIKPFKSLN
ncbi:Sporulation domain-containing protein [Pseudopedobacter saltans DSM 12145]|uniref:Sporulation domain-containing protein n=1 Tax=Pseudopedobacter saltans (strain ATCC 51119 / DSM 12145 / JCM 21818 / CCUG 39354 / LMG 10337 / NBRC 100064 / NCIMB 13643) TaxID=762903 RepID=F0S9C3_PSESL|nr:SPOR domain-containing protein [Pseudopedobacter saltans]ADY52473.1 Sporulation domain-containing protein [Pseudopedobacter saltans DSM 12145]